MRKERAIKGKMLRKAGVGAVVFSAALTLSGCHSHEWTEADCISPQTCVECGETEGEALGHKWEEATCVLPVTCSVCGETEGEAMGHKWEEATCALPATCGVCGETDGETLPHTWMEANFQRPATCSDCGETEGEAWTPGFVSEGITCYEEVNTAYEYITRTMYASEEKTTGRLILAECQVLEPDETLETVEGYEWSTARLELLFNDRNAWMYGASFSFGFMDYYDMELCADSMEEIDESSYQYTVNYNGEEYSECRFIVTGSDWSEWRYGTSSLTLDVAFRVPEGYDGVVAGFGDPTLISGEDPEDLEGNSEDNSEESGSEEFDLASEGSVYIRLNSYAAQDTEYPRMVVTNGCIPIQPGEALESSAVIRTGTDHDGSEMGFFDFRKVGELTDFDAENYWESEPVYVEEKLAEDTELALTLDIPEEGVYEVTAAVRDQNGNAMTTLLTILADGTAPEIHVPKETVTLREGQGFSPTEDVYGVDNFWTREDCLMDVNIEEYVNLLAAAESGKTGSYTLTYTITDVAGNVGEKKITVKLTTGGSSQGGGQTASTPDTGGNSQGGGQTASTPDTAGNAQQQDSAQFMADMAKAAFANVNAYRAEAGLEALVWDDAIYAATQTRAQELVSTFSHTRPDGSSCFTALSGGYTTAGENIAMGQRSAESVCNSWYNSPGHKANMLNENYTKGAIACWYENGTYYWVNLFTG